MSNDGTKFIIQRYLNKNVRYICRADKNYYDALNYGIKVASGDYIGILNAGDKYFNSNILNLGSFIIPLGLFVNKFTVKIPGIFARFFAISGTKFL